MPRIDQGRMPEGPVIQAFSGNGFKVDGVLYPGGLKLTPRQASGWDAPAVDGLRLSDFADLLALAPAPEFLILGTGQTLRRPAPDLLARLDIGVEVMDSRAAARAWMVLRGEDRWIAALLLPFDQR